MSCVSYLYVCPIQKERDTSCGGSLLASCFTWVSFIVPTRRVACWSVPPHLRASSGFPITITSFMFTRYHLTIYPVRKYKGSFDIKMNAETSLHSRTGWYDPANCQPARYVHMTQTRSTGYQLIPDGFCKQRTRYARRTRTYEVRVWSIYLRCQNSNNAAVPGG